MLKLAIIVALTVWFVDRSGPARLVWGGYVIETSAAFIGFCALAVGFVFYGLLRLWRLLRHGPTHLRLRHTLKKWQQGHDHLTHGLVAIASGDAIEAGRRSVHARRLLGVTGATRLLQAQAAQLAGDRDAAQEIFRALAAEPDSAIIGYRGLIMGARRERNWAEAERLVEKLHSLKPKIPWLNLIRFDLLTRRQAWDEANIALAQAASSRLLEPARVKKHRAAILVATAQNEVRQGRYDKALQAPCSARSRKTGSACHIRNWPFFCDPAQVMPSRSANRSKSSALRTKTLPSAIWSWRKRLFLLISGVRHEGI
jgi:HemY protein